MRSRSRALLALLTLPGCLLDWQSLRNVDGGGPPPADAGSGEAAREGGSDGGCAPRLIVNELTADGVTANDEYVEIYNDSTCATSLDKWSVQYSSASGSPPVTGWIGAADDTVDAKGYFLVVGDGFTPPPGAHAKHWTNVAFPQSGLLSKNGGGVGLVSPQSKVVDSVAYATISAPAHPFVRPQTAPDGGVSTPAPNPPSGQSVSRVPNGVDTDVNSADFKVAARTPGAPN